MSFARSMRVIHNWTSVVVLLTALSISVTGLLLSIKKYVPAIQPTVASAKPGLSDLSTLEIFAAVKADERFQNLTLTDIDRIDIRPKDGVAKVILQSFDEIQISLHSAEIIKVSYRTSDWIEDIHDFSFLGEGLKLVVAISSGLAFLTLWATGSYLFVLPYLKRLVRKKDAAR